MGPDGHAATGQLVTALLAVWRYGAAGTNLGVLDGVDGAGRREVEDTRAPARGVEQRGAVQEVAAEEAEAAVAGAGGEIEEVVRLRPVICIPRRTR